MALEAASSSTGASKQEQVEKESSGKGAEQPAPTQKAMPADSKEAKSNGADKKEASPPARAAAGGGSNFTPDPSDFSVRHPLQHSWTMWYDPPKKGRMSAKNWQNSVKKIMDFDTVEDFWCMFNNLAPPDRLAHGCNYHLFKKGIHPSWEDEFNKDGGKWVHVHRDVGSLNMVWENSVLGMIGEMFDHPDEVLGIVLSIRKSKNRIALWTRTAVKEEVCIRVGQQWKQLAELPANMKLEYQIHADALKTKSSFANSAAYVI